MLYPVATFSHIYKNKLLKGSYSPTLPSTVKLMLAQPQILYFFMISGSCLNFSSCSEIFCLISNFIMFSEVEVMNV